MVAPRLATTFASGEQESVDKVSKVVVTPADLKRWATAMELLADWPAAEPVLRSLSPRTPPRR